MKTLLVKDLEKGYKVVMTDSRDIDGWVSYWIRDPSDRDIKSFYSRGKALQWWKRKKEVILVDPAYEKAEREAQKLTKRMGVQWSTLSEEEQREWTEEVLDA